MYLHPTNTTNEAYIYIYIYYKLRLFTLIPSSPIFHSFALSLVEWLNDCDSIHLYIQPNNPTLTTFTKLLLRRGGLRCTYFLDNQEFGMTDDGSYFQEKENEKERYISSLFLSFLYVYTEYWIWRAAVE